MITPAYLGAINITAWLYRDRQGIAQTPDAELGIHSEAKPAEWFRRNPDLTVLQIFTKRIPCPIMCAPLSNTYLPAEVLKSAYGL